ncbi:MAG: 3-hydroxybutyrate dehydrogenase [Pseudomonadota bacterium]
MLTGKRAFISGSTSGIGKAIAGSLAKAGAEVVINGFGDQAEIEAQLETLNAISKASYAAADMSKATEIEAIFEDLGQIDILINNAGIQHVAPIEDFPAESWDAIIAINLSSAFHCTKAAMPAMKKAGWGRVINIASAHSLVASPFKSAYVAAKHGIAGLTKSVALEVAELGITVNAISPGYVKTPLVEAQIPDTARIRGITEAEVIRDVMLAPQPTKEFVATEDIGAMAVFLCSHAAKAITGANLSIDGGWVAK